MRRSRFAFIFLGAMISIACGQAQVVVTAEIEVPNPEGEGMVVRPLADTEVHLLPFNRDLVFDSVAAAFPTPEPEIPQDLLVAQEEISAAQADWRAAEAQWAALRDRLQSITQQMEGLARGEAQYVALFREFEDGEQRLVRVERAKDQAFERFTELQEGYIQRADSMRVVLDQWAEEAFEDVNEVFATKLRESGRGMVVDTTDADGIVVMPVSDGQWWVHARHELPFSILYWNIDINVEGKEPFQVLLNESTAEVRPKL